MRVDKKLFVEKMQSDTAFVAMTQSDPAKALEEVKGKPIDNNRVFTILLLILGIVILFCVGAVLSISLSDGLVISQEINDKLENVTVKREVNQIFLMIGSAAIGALTGLLVPRENSSNS